jgi:hypothetical protein
MRQERREQSHPPNWVCFVQELLYYETLNLAVLPLRDINMDLRRPANLAEMKARGIIPDRFLLLTALDELTEKGEKVICAACSWETVLGNKRKLVLRYYRKEDLPLLLKHNLLSTKVHIIQPRTILIRATRLTPRFRDLKPQSTV